LRSFLSRFGLVHRLLFTAVAALTAFASLASGASAASGDPARSTLREVPFPKTEASAASEFPRTGVVRALKIGEPLASLSNANTTVAPFQIAFSYSVVRPGTLKLKEILLKPVLNSDSVKGGCGHCVGKGQFLPYTIHRGLFTEHVRGTRLMTTSTRIVQAVIHPGKVGRFKLYGVSVGPPSTTALLDQGCIAADAISPAGGTSTGLLTALLHPRAGVLPVVPCTGVPRGDNVTFFRPPIELLPTTTPTGGFAGHTSGPRWLSVFQATRPCAPDPLAEAQLTKLHIFWHLSGGSFSHGFRGLPPTKAGFFCGYLQSGGTFAGIPDGRIGLTWSVPFYVGDNVAISGETTVAAGSEVNDVFTGFASAAEQLWIFDSFTPCANTAEGEYPPAADVFHTPENGRFSINVTSIKLNQSFYRCAYLNVGAPSNGKPTGPTLARASLFVTVQ
jgi:hypothetical protein